MCLEGTSVHGWGCFKWGAKSIKLKENCSQEIEKGNIFFFNLSLGFQNKTSSLTELDTNFPAKSLSSYTLAPGESSFGCCESIFWLSVQAWCPIISRPRWKIFGIKHELSTTLNSTLELRNHLRGKKFQHLEKPLGSDRNCSTWIQLAFKRWFPHIHCYVYGFDIFFYY